MPFEKSVINQLKKPIRAILFIRIDRIGDLVLSTPTIKTLKKSYPKSQLIVLASKANHAVLEENPYVDDTIIYNAQKGFISKIKVIKRLRKYNFDLAIDSYAGNELKTALIAHLSGAKEKIGFSNYGREIFFNKYAIEVNKKQHFVDLTLDVLKPLNIKIDEKFPKIYSSEKEWKWSANWIKKKITGIKPIIGIHPGAHYDSQRWLIDSFAELTNKLLEDDKYEIIFFGGPDDVELIKRINSQVHKKAIIFISPNIREFISLLYYCNIFICNNSGPLHIAVATNTPTISFMGPTVKKRWMPLGDIHKVLRIDNLQCIGCNCGSCIIKTHDCMRLITPAAVIKNIKKLMAKNINNNYMPPYRFVRNI